MSRRGGIRLAAFSVLMPRPFTPALPADRGAAAGAKG